MGARYGLESGWFNDHVLMFTSPDPEFTPFGDFPAVGDIGLRVLVASPRYILAMKAMACRSPLETSDLVDTWNLVDACGLKTMDETRVLVARFFPGDDLPEHAEWRLAELFERNAGGAGHNPMDYW